jgi:hypothetical protein
MKWILRGLLLLMGAFFLLSLVVVAAVLFLLSLIRWLFTGRKPSILMAVTAYQQWKHSSRWSSGYRQRSSEDIIEAEVKDVRVQQDHQPIPQRKE